MDLNLLLNGVVSGLLLGCLYGVAAAGLAISFGMLNIVNIAHPAMMVLGAFAVSLASQRLGLDPLLATVLLVPLFWAAGAGLYSAYYRFFERRGDEAIQGLAFFFGIMFIIEVALVISFGPEQQWVDAPYASSTWHLGPIDFPLRMTLPGLLSLASIGLLILFLKRTFIGRAIAAVAQDPQALRFLAIDPIRIKRIAFGISTALAGLAGGALVLLQPVEPTSGQLFIGRVFAIVIMGGMASLSGALLAALLFGVIENMTAILYGPSWSPAVAFGLLLSGIDRATAGPVRKSGMTVPQTMAAGTSALLSPHRRLHAATWRFWLVALVVAALLFAAVRAIGNDYAYFAGYVVLQYIVLATGWNVLGGYAGYVNFGAAAFFATGAYGSVVLKKAFGLDLLPAIVVGGVASGLLGLVTGYLTLRLRGVYFSIATLCLAVVLETLVVNWRYIGGSRGAYMVHGAAPAPFASYAEFLFVVMLVLVLIAVGVARGIERSRFGIGLAALRDDERAAEAAGVPTLKLKLAATAISGALMGMAGAPLSYYTSFINPDSAFALSYTVSSMAMPLIGGTQMWLGPVIGAVLLSSLQQAVTVTISSAGNLLIVGVVLVCFVILAPNGLIGLVRGHRK